MATELKALAFIYLAFSGVIAPVLAWYLYVTGSTFQAAMMGAAHAMTSVGTLVVCFMAVVFVFGIWTANGGDK